MSSLAVAEAVASKRAVMRAMRASNCAISSRRRAKPSNCTQHMYDGTIHMRICALSTSYCRQHM